MSGGRIFVENSRCLIRRAPGMAAGEHRFRIFEENSEALRFFFEKSDSSA